VHDIKYGFAEVPTMALLKHLAHGGNLARANPNSRSKYVEENRGVAHV
jgi:hypothetical protein